MDIEKNVTIKMLRDGITKCEAQSTGPSKVGGQSAERWTLRMVTKAQSAGLKKKEGLSAERWPLRKGSEAQSAGQGRGADRIALAFEGRGAERWSLKGRGSKRRALAFEGRRAKRRALAFEEIEGSTALRRRSTECWPLSK
jgi:hypothetical protein